MSEVNSNGVGYIDGRYCPRSELSIPISDLGFLLGDTTYDALHVHEGSFFRLDDHLERFESSMQRRGFTSVGLNREQMVDVLSECVRRSQFREAMVMMIVTRGDPSGSSKDLRTCKNRFIAWAAPYYNIVSDEQMENGLPIIVSKVQRIPPESVDPTVKNFGRLDFCDALMEAYGRGCDHAVLLNAQGEVTEGRGWNIFTYRNGELISPEAGVLEGITRRTIIELAERGNLKARTGRISEVDLKQAEEVFITSSAGGVMPVTRIDDSPVGDGSPGPVTRRLEALYWASHADPAFSTPISYEAEPA